MKYYPFLASLLSTRAIARTASSAPPHPATGLLSRDSSTVYLFMPSSTSASPTDFRFVSLRLNVTFSAENISSAFTELPRPPPSHDRNPETQVSITPLLFSNPSSAGEGVLDEKVVIFSGSCDSEVALYEYNLTDSKAGWKTRGVVPADGLGRLDIDINSLPLPKGRYYGRAFAYSIASTTSTIAPSSTFMKGQSREGDDALKEYEQGVVVTTTTESKAFMFGGQCPTFSSRGDEGTWSVSRAMYSGSMLAVEFPISRTFAFSPGKQKGTSSPTMRGSNNPDSLSAVLSENNGHGSYGEWPIPEAGFSLTTIPTGDTSMNVVMIGGHTEKAFVDMRQVAVYQVPEGRWKFADVELPKAAPPKLSSSSTRVATDPRPTTETETTREDPSTAVRTVQRRQEDKDTRRIDPRSGHTAVATKDGKRVIVYGGWVGNVNTPAEPRLIVLELVGDVGKENWRWEIPYTRSGEHGPPADGEEEGLSGHAAVMLEGDVMMVTSGYRISPFTNASEVSDRSFFYNVTSASWVPTYKPAHVLAAEMKGLHDCDRARRTTSIVLGVVLTSAAIAAVVIGYLWYFRKGRKGHDAEKAVYCRPLERERWGSFGFYGKPSASEERLGASGFYNHSTKPSISQERMVGGGPYGSSAKSMAMSQERVGIVETRSHSYRVLGDDGSRSGTPDGLQRAGPLRTVPLTTAAPRPPPKAVLKTNPGRVSTIFEAEEYDRRSSCGATVGSDDLAELYNRSLAFAEKMAAQETIYEQSRSRSGTPSDEWSDTSHRHHALPRPPPRAALSSESLMSLPMAPMRIPYAHSFPPARAAAPTPKIRTLLTPARFFPIPKKPAAAAATATANRRVVSLSHHGAPSPPMATRSPKHPRRWASISALRNALPDILPTSPISLWEHGISRGGQNNTSRSSASGSDTLSVPIVLDTALLGSERGGVRFSVGDDDWDLEAAIEKRVVQVMFTAPKGALRVVNLDERGVVGQDDDEEESEEEAEGERAGGGEEEGGEEQQEVETEVLDVDVEEGEIVIEMREEVLVEMTCQ